MNAALLGDQGGEISPEADDRQVLYLHGRLYVEEVAVELFIDRTHVIDRLEVVEGILVWIGVLNDLVVEDLADHVLPSLDFTHVIELLLERHLQLPQGELVSL
jgi:hypothetical protein